jgi:PAS domain S-box-containing protein
MAIKSIPFGLFKSKYNVFVDNLKYYKLGLIFFAVIFPALGIAINIFVAQVYDPIIFRIIISILCLALLVLVSTKKVIENNFYLLFSWLLFLMVVWSIFIAYKNEFSLGTTATYMLILSGSIIASRKIKHVVYYSVATTALTVFLLYLTRVDVFNQILLVSSIVSLQFIFYLFIKSKKESDKELINSEEKYRTLVENTYDIIYTLNPEGYFTYVSPSWQMLLGHHIEDVVGKSFVPFVHPQDVYSCKLFLEKVIETGQKQAGVEYRVKHIDGTWRWHTTSASPIVNKTGEVIGFNGIARDITESKQARDMLQAERDYSNSIIRGTNALICGIAPDGTCLYLNPAAAKVVGFEESEIVGRNWWTTLYPGDDYEQVNQLFRAFQKGQVYDYEMTLTRKDGSKRIVAWNSINRYDSRGNLMEVIGFGHNITDRKLAEEALKESEERYRIIFNQSKDAIMTLAPPDWLFTSANPSIVDMFGAKDVKEFVSLHPWNVSPEYQPDGQLSSVKAKEMIGIAMKEGFHYFEWVHRRVDGTDFPATVTLSRINMSGKTFLHAVVRNITLQKQAQDDLIKSEEKYRSLFENAVEGIYQSTLQGYFISANPFLAFILGFDSPKELIEAYSNISVQLYANASDRDRLIKILETDGKVTGFETQLTKKDGSTVWVSICARKVNNEDGSIAYFEGTIEDIGNRKQTEELLKQTKQTYLDIFNTLTEAIYVQDESGTFIEVNKGAEIMYGLSRDELVGQNPTTVTALGMNNLEEVGRCIESTFKSGIPSRFEFWGKKKDGKPFPKDVIINKGKYFGKDVLITTARDITLAKQVELALKESEERFRSLYENAIMGIYRTTPDGKILMANPSFVKMMGYNSIEEMNAINIEGDNVYVDINQRALFKQIAEKEGYVVGFEADLYRKDGTVIYVRENAKAIKDDSGNVIYYEGTVEDITEKRFRNIIDNQGEGFCTVDRNESFTFANSAACELFGAENGRLTGKNLREFVNDDDWNLILSQTQRIIKGERSSYGLTINIPNGERKHIIITASPNYDKNNNIIGSIGVFRDITALKNAEMALKESEERFKTLFSESPVSIYIHDKDTGEIIDANKNALENYKFKSIDQLRKRAFLMESPYSFIEANEWLQKADKFGMQEFEWCSKKENGEIFWEFIRLMPITINGIRRLVAVTIDITKRKQAEEYVKQTTERLKAIVRIFEHKAESIEGLLEFALNEALFITGSRIGYIYDYSEKSGKLSYNSWIRSKADESSIETSEECFALLQKILLKEVVQKRKEIVRNDFEFIPKKSEGCPDFNKEVFRFMSLPVFENESMVAVVGVANKKEAYNENDLSQLKLLMRSAWGLIKKKIDSEKITKLSVAVEQSSALVLITDANGVIEYVNPKFTDLTGYSFDEVIGKTPRILNSGHHDKAFFANLWKTILSGNDWRGQLVNRKKNGELFWELASISPIFNSKGVITHFIAVKEDITQRVEAEKEMNELNKNLVSAIETLQNQKELIESAHKKITDSIDYAQLIQKSILPRPKMLNEFFSGHFIYFEPKDVVSGDFYWYKKIGNKIVFAVADCTGHGVPGAFMSILSINLLEIVCKSNLDSQDIDPTIILDDLNEKLTQAIMSDPETEFYLKDGMDIALCVFDFDNSVLKFAGANNPAIIIRKKMAHDAGEDYSDWEFIRLSATGRSIGYSLFNTKFSTTEVKLFPDDRIYMFSDGYYDQFGEMNSKFSRKKFYNLLIEIQKEPFSNHGLLFEKTHKEWKGNKEQIDDILIVGLKI